MKGLSLSAESIFHWLHQHQTPGQGQGQEQGQGREQQEQEKEKEQGQEEGRGPESTSSPLPPPPLSLSLSLPDIHKALSLLHGAVLPEGRDRDWGSLSWLELQLLASLRPGQAQAWCTAAEAAAVGAAAIGREHEEGGALPRGWG